MLGKPYYLNCDDNHILWRSLSRNPNAIHILDENIDKLDWCWEDLSSNPSAVYIFVEKFKNNWNKLNGMTLDGLTTNRNAVDIIIKNHDKLDKLNIKLLAINSNPKMLELIEKYIVEKPWLLDSFTLSLNPNAIKLLEKYPYMINWSALNANPNAIHILEQNMDKLDWNLSVNPNAIHILEKNLDKVSWYNLSRNPNAIHILEQNLDKVCWYNLSQNENAISLLEKNPNNVNIYGLSVNNNPKSLNLLNKYYNKKSDKEFWECLSSNPNAIQILENNLDLTDMSSLTENENAIHLLFKLDKEKMRLNMKHFAEELVAKVFHPYRLLRLCEIYEIDLDDLIEILY